METQFQNGLSDSRLQKIAGLLVPTSGSAIGLLTPSGELISLKGGSKVRRLSSFLGESIEVLGRLQSRHRKKKELHVLTYSIGLSPPLWGSEEIRTTA